MAVGPMGVLDLSIVTDRLLGIINEAFASTPIWPGGPLVTAVGSAPHALQAGGETHVSLYLFHVAQDPHQLNVPLNAPYQLEGDPPTPLGALAQPPPRAYRIPYLPLGLDLHYLLTAYAGDEYVLEQQAMSVAMTALHQNPLVSMTAVLDGQPVDEQFTVTMSVESTDELSRLWQATTAPLRLSAVYRVSVVFLAPQALADTEAPGVERVVVAADAADLPLSALGDVSGTSIAAGYSLPDGTLRPYDLAPAVAAPGDTVALHGAGLDRSTAAHVYLFAPPPGGPPIDVTAWRTDSPPLPESARLELPGTAQTAPPVTDAATPAPGVYQLAVGSADPAGHRSRQTPFSIAARVDPGAGTALLVAAGGVYHVTGAGFVEGRTELMLGTARLAEAAAPPGPGTFAIGADGTTLDFAPPASLAPGRYAVRIRVNGIESRPAWWVDA